MTTTTPTKTPPDVAVADALQIDPLDIRTMLIPIIGTAPLIMHRFDEKAKRQMLDRMQGKKAIKQRRDPQADYEAAFHRYVGSDGVERYGFPTLGFKAATISAVRLYGKPLTMTGMRQLLSFGGVRSAADDQQLTLIEGEPVMREDMVRVGMTTDLRYRPEFDAGWTATLEVRFVATSIQANSVLSLVSAGGMTVGVGEWRPEKSGENGTYEIDADRQVVQVPRRSDAGYR